MDADGNIKERVGSVFCSCRAKFTGSRSEPASGKKYVMYRKSDKAGFRKELSDVQEVGQSRLPKRNK